MNGETETAGPVASSDLLGRCNSLLKTWEHRSRRKWLDAESEKDLAGKHLIEHGAVCYANAASELRRAIQTGDVTANFMLKPLNEDTKSE